MVRRNPLYWNDCPICDPLPDGTARQHYQNTRNPKHVNGAATRRLVDMFAGEMPGGAGTPTRDPVVVKYRRLQREAAPGFIGPTDAEWNALLVSWGLR